MAVGIPTLNTHVGDAVAGFLVLHTHSAIAWQRHQTAHTGERDTLVVLPPVQWVCSVVSKDARGGRGAPHQNAGYNSTMEPRTELP